MSVPLDSKEIERFKLALRAYLSLPFSPDLAPEAAEEILAWAVQGTTHAKASGMKRSKLLFDVTRGEVGWSLKTFAPSSLQADQVFEVVLARAAVKSDPEDTKTTAPRFTMESASAQEIGDRALEIRRSVLVKSVQAQDVSDLREAFLLRHGGNTEFVYFEHPLIVEDPGTVSWRFSDESTRAGIQGSVNGELRYRWYRSGGQLFGIFSIPGDETNRFDIEWNEMDWDELISRILKN